MADIPTSSCTASLGERLHRTGRLMRQRLVEELAAAGHVYPVEFWPTLNYLNSQPGANQDEIATFLVRDKATAARLLSRMEKAGLLVRQVDPDNRRCKRVRLSSRGQVTHQQLTACAARVRALALQNIPAAQLAICSSVLGDVFQNLASPSRSTTAL